MRRLRFFRIFHDYFFFLSPFLFCLYDHLFISPPLTFSPTSLILLTLSQFFISLHPLLSIFIPSFPFLIFFPSYVSLIIMSFLCSFHPFAFPTPVSFLFLLFLSVYFPFSFASIPFHLFPNPCQPLHLSSLPFYPFFYHFLMLFFLHVSRLPPLASPFHHRLIPVIF